MVRAAGVDGIEYRHQFSHHFQSERVHAVRAMQSYCRDIVADVVPYGGIGHGCSPQTNQPLLHQQGECKALSSARTAR
jgi:hypothetical protein